MKMEFLVLLSGAGALAAPAWAQMTPQQQQQLPPSDPSSSQYHSVYLPSLGQGDTVQPSTKWKDRWGAIATDAKDAKLGVSVDMLSKREAERAALSECKREGGKSCKLEISYYNQCAVLVTGDQIYNTSSASTIEKASEISLAKCEQDDSNRRVYYSGCSLPVRVQ